MISGLHGLLLCVANYRMKYRHKALFRYGQADLAPAWSPPRGYWGRNDVNRKYRRNRYPGV